MSAVRLPVRSRALAFIESTGTVSPAVLQLGNGQNAVRSINELERLIGADPEFSLRVLSLANSAFYSQRYRIDSLRSALVVLGSGIVHRLAAGMLATTLIGRRDPTREAFWRHSLAVGVAARLLAEAHRHVEPEQAFVAGILHDIGLLAIHHSTLPDEEPANELAGHGSLGAEIAGLLNIPPNLCAAIANHDDARCLERVDQALEATVFTANVLAKHCGYGITDASEADPALLQKAIGALGLLETDVTTLSSCLAENVTEMSEMYGHASSETQ